MAISFLLAPCRSPSARTNALDLCAKKKNIWLGKVQRSLGKKRFVSRPLDRAPCEISPVHWSFAAIPARRASHPVKPQGSQSLERPYRVVLFAALHMSVCDAVDGSSKRT